MEKEKHARHPFKRVRKVWLFKKNTCSCQIGLDARKSDCVCLRTTKAQTSLRIRAV